MSEQAVDRCFLARASGLYAALLTALGVVLKQLD
jgi:hypothetical protein